MSVGESTCGRTDPAVSVLWNASVIPSIFKVICIGNSMICRDIWHKYHKWYFKIVIRNLRQFWNITSGIYAKYHVQIMLLFVYTTTLKRFVIFTRRYFKLSWNNTALSQSNCSNFSCSSISTRNINYVLLLYGKPMLETMPKTTSCSDHVKFHPGQYHEIEMRMLVGKLE